MTHREQQRIHLKHSLFQLWSFTKHFTPLSLDQSDAHNSCRPHTHVNTHKHTSTYKHAQRNTQRHRGGGGMARACILEWYLDNRLILSLLLQLKQTYMQVAFTGLFSPSLSLHLDGGGSQCVKSNWNRWPNGHSWERKRRSEEMPTQPGLKSTALQLQ